MWYSVKGSRGIQGVNIVSCILFCQLQWARVVERNVRFLVKKKNKKLLAGIIIVVVAAMLLTTVLAALL